MQGGVGVSGTHGPLVRNNLRGIRFCLSDILEIMNKIKEKMNSKRHDTKDETPWKEEERRGERKLELEIG